MKKIVITAAALFAAVISIVAQTRKDIKAEINHVTVFPDRAQVTHESSVSVSPGKSGIRLTGLSPYIDAQSVQVKGVGEFTILSVNHQNNYLENLEDSPEMKNIRSQIEALQLKVEDETAALETLKGKESFLAANQAILVKGSTFTIEQMKNVMDLYTNSLDQVATSKLKKSRLIKDYEKQIAALQQQISEKRGRQQLPSGEITVSVSSEKPVTAKLLFSYVVMNAGWYPSYDIRVEDIKNPVAISYKANVFQNTGVEWKDVKLSVSNASAYITGDIPAFTTWFIDYYNPAPQMMMRSKSADISAKEEVVMMEMEQGGKLNARPMAAAPPPVEKQIGETTVTFDISVPYTIASDGKVQTVEIQQIEAPAEYKYVSLPKLSPMAYLTANIPDWAKLSLQSGEATLYFENSFVGKSNLNVNQMSDTLAISLGTDNSILVKREKRQDFTSRKVLGSNKTDTYSYLLTIRNNKQVPVRMTLRDQIPVSTNSGITVDAVELSGGRHNTYTGEISWDIDLKQAETKLLILTYSVKYPKDRTIIID